MRSFLYKTIKGLEKLWDKKPKMQVKTEKNTIERKLLGKANLQGFTIVVKA